MLQLHGIALCRRNVLHGYTPSATSVWLDRASQLVWVSLTWDFGQNVSPLTGDTGSRAVQNFTECFVLKLFLYVLSSKQRN